jgi:hypothetical protein
MIKQRVRESAIQSPFMPQGQVFVCYSHHRSIHNRTYRFRKNEHFESMKHCDSLSLDETHGEGMFRGF